MRVLGWGAFAEGKGRFAGPFFVGAEVEAEEGGVEFAAGLESRFLAPPFSGAQYSRSPERAAEVPSGVRQSGDSRRKALRRRLPEEPGHGTLCQG